MIAAELRGSSKPGLNEALGWIGSRVDDVYGASVGRLEDIWIDPGTGDPRWLLVKEGRFGGRSTLIPFEDASAGAGHVWVPYERDVVRGAPEVEPGAPLTQQVESALRDHYVSNAALSHSDQAAAAVTPGAVSELAHEHQQPEHPPPQYPPRPAPQPPQMQPAPQPPQQQPAPQYPQQQPAPQYPQQQPAPQYPQQQPAPIQYPQQAPPQRPAPIQYPQQQPQQQPAPIQYPQQAPRPAPQAPDPGPYSRNDAGPPAALSFPGPPAEEHPRAGSTPIAARQTPQPPVVAAPPMRPPAPPMRPPAPIQYRPDPAAVPMPQVARAEQHTPAPPAGPESLPQRPAVPPQPQPAVVATPPQQGHAEQPTAIPVIHALDRPYRVEIQLEGDLKISGELKGFSLTPTDDSAD